MQDPIALVSPLKSSYSETFIKAHVDMLDFKVHHFYSIKNKGYYPIYNPEGKALFTTSPIALYTEAIFFKTLNNPGIAFWFREQALRKYLKAHNIQAVLTEFGPTAAVLFKACAKINIPIIAHFHGRDAYHYDTIRTYKDLYHQMFLVAETVISVSEDMKDQLVNLGCPKTKVLVNPCGPNNAFDINIDVVKNKPILVSTGRFVEKKAPLITIKAFAKAKKKCPDLEMIMLADGPLWDDAKTLAKELKLENHISFTGPVNSEHVMEYLKNARAFVQHSVRSADGDSEGTPVSILEAMLMGLPVISTRHAGIIDISIEGKTALLTNEHDVDKMADYMVFVANEPEKAASIGKAAKLHVKQHFSMDIHIERLNTIIRNAIQKNKKSTI